VLVVGPGISAWRKRMDSEAGKATYREHSIHECINARFRQWSLATAHRSRQSQCRRRAHLLANTASKAGRGYLSRGPTGFPPHEQLTASS
jgi:hypothetical protein